MKIFGCRRESRNPAKRGDAVSCAAHGHRLRNPRSSRGRFPGPAGHRVLMARDARAAGRAAGADAGVMRRAPHAVHHPCGSGTITGRQATSSWHGGLPPPIPPGPP
jgi:hypothetical protein